MEIIQLIIKLLDVNMILSYKDIWIKPSPPGIYSEKMNFYLTLDKHSL